MNIPFTIILFGLIAAGAEILGGSVVLHAKGMAAKNTGIFIGARSGFYPGARAAGPYSRKHQQESGPQLRFSS